MALNAQKMELGLLAHNFFPRVAKRGDEFPPSFVSTAFTPDLASKIIVLRSRKGGYGSVAARSTRYDLAPRNMEICHPRAFAAVSRQLKTSWNEWKAILSNPSSAIRVGEHADGRVFSMIASRETQPLIKPGSRFQAKVDVTNFYGSVYTHSFPWAVHGLDVAKGKRDDKSDWANQLDFALRQARRGETTGLSVGPGTSAIAGEILLGHVDRRLRAQGFEYVRFIDDYFFIGDTRDSAELFVAAVRDELSRLKLSIHPGKTRITELPLALSPAWQRHLRSTLRGPKRLARLLDALDEAIDISSSDPENGVLRYALVGVEEALAEDELSCKGQDLLVDRLLHIGYLRPIVIGTVCRILLAMGPAAVLARQTELNLILQEHAMSLRTDAATWLLHTPIASGASPSKSATKAVIQARDCLMMALLAEDPSGRNKVKKFLSKLEAEQPEDYRRDEYWLLYYQFALKGDRLTTVPKAYYDEFEPLLKAHVSFVELGAASPYLPTAEPPVMSPDAPRVLSGGAGSRTSPYAE